MSENFITLDGKRYGKGHALIVAEMSANHCGDLNTALAIVRAAHDSGADAIKVQTFTANTISIRAEKPFLIEQDTLWDGRDLFDLYDEASLPWEWHAEIQKLAVELGLHFFSSPFDVTAVDFLEELGVPAYKIASPELIDHQLIARAAQTGKPLIISTGMGTLTEIAEAVEIVRKNGCEELSLLKCTSQYPAPMSTMNLRSIPVLAQMFDVLAGLSDHTMGSTAALVSVSLGGGMIEKHFTTSRDNAGPDSQFSMEPSEFRSMVTSIREAEAALGAVVFEPSHEESKSLAFRRSLFVAADIRAGEPFTMANVKSVRPATGVEPRWLPLVLGRIAAVSIPAGTPLTWDLVGGSA